jgi:hypothetical protein
MSVRQALRPLRNLASDLEIAILGLVHLNKGDTLDIAARLAGSAAFRNVARSVLVVADYPEEDGWRVVFQNKSNLGAENGHGRLYRVEGAEYTDLKDQPVFDSQGVRATTGRIVWGNQVELDPSSLPTREAERAAPKRTDAADMLHVLLKAGPQPAAWLEEQAKLDGLSCRTVNTAKADEEIEHRQFHWPDPRRAGPSWWGLPGTDWDRFRSAMSCVPEGCRPENVLRTLIERGDWPREGSGLQSPGTQREEVAHLIDALNPDDPDHGLHVAELRAEEVRHRRSGVR